MSSALFVALTEVTAGLGALGVAAALLLAAGGFLLWRWRKEQRDGRLLRDLADSAGLREVMRRTLETARAVPGADAALISVGTGDGEPEAEWVGMSEHEAEAHRLGDGRRIQSVLLSVEDEKGEQEWVGLTQAEVEERELERVSEERLICSLLIRYETGVPAAAGQQAPITAGLAVPIGTARAAVGVLSIFSRAPTVFSESQLGRLEEIARRAAPFIEMRQQVDSDELTGLNNFRFFKQTLANAVAAAQQHSREEERREGIRDRRLALLFFDLDDFGAINKQIGDRAGDAVLAEVGRRLRRIVRRADIPCRKGGDEFVVILPDSGLEDADRLYQRLQEAITLRPIIDRGQVVIEAGARFISAGATELRREDDPDLLFERADQAKRHAKEWGKRRLSWAEGDRSEPPPKAAYRHGTSTSQCGGCEQFRPGQRDTGYCEHWHAPVAANHVCNEFEPKRTTRETESQAPRLLAKEAPSLSIPQSQAGIGSRAGQAPDRTSLRLIPHGNAPGSDSQRLQTRPRP